MLLRRSLSKLLLSRGSNKRPRHSRDRHSRPFFSASQARPYTSDVPSQRLALNNGPGLRDFIASNSLAGTGSVSSVAEDGVEEVPYTSVEDIAGRGRKVYFETYGCQMNVNDTEVAWAILSDSGYTKADNAPEADVILAVTCSVRENAENKVWSRLDYFRSLKQKRSSKLPPLKVGVLGCMAERLKKQLLETDKMVDLVAGPDAYRDLPRMLSLTESGQAAVNVLLSLDETYADVMPIRLNQDSPSAFISIMRGCENMCSFCIVPFTRGRERSRPIDSILQEVKMLSDQGVKEITLLGQNVNSYRDLSSSISPSSSTSPSPSCSSSSPSSSSSSSSPSSSCSSSSSSFEYRTDTQLSRGFRTIYRSKDGGRRFTELLDRVSLVDPEMRIRFTSPHPKDFPDELLYLIRERANICRHIHLPAQSGSTSVLERMRRGYSRDSYLALVETVRHIIPGVTLSSDFMTGFCGETEEEHCDTLSLMEAVGYDMAYMFAFSMRKKTHAYHRMEDSVAVEVKQRRLREVIDAFYTGASRTNQRFIGSEQLVLVEKTSRRSSKDLVGRSDGNIKVIFPDVEVPCDIAGSGRVRLKAGDYVSVEITGAGPVTLQGNPIVRTTLQKFSSKHDHCSSVVHV